MRTTVIAFITAFFLTFFVHAAGKEAIPYPESAPPKENVVTLSPTIYILPNDACADNQTDSPTPVIDIASLQVLFDFPLLFLHGHSEIDGVVVLNQEARIYNGIGDTIYARQSFNRLQKGDKVSIVHPDTAMHSPHSLKQLGTPAWKIANGIVTYTSKNTATLRILSAKKEIITGDIVTTAKHQLLENFTVRYSPKPITGTIISIAWGEQEASLYSTVTLDRGKIDGVQPGHVFMLYDTSSGHNAFWGQQRSARRWLQDKGHIVPIAAATIFRVYDRISYGMITDAQGAVFVGDQGTTLTRHYDRLNPSLSMTCSPEK